MTPSSRIRCVLTARDTGARLAEQPPLAPPSGGSELPTVMVDTGVSVQHIEAFGGAFTEAAAVNWRALGAAHREQVLEAYFDAARGHGY